MLSRSQVQSHWCSLCWHFWLLPNLPTFQHDCYRIWINCPPTVCDPLPCRQPYPFHPPVLSVWTMLFYHVLHHTPHTAFIIPLVPPFWSLSLHLSSLWFWSVFVAEWAASLWTRAFKPQGDEREGETACQGSWVFLKIFSIHRWTGNSDWNEAMVILATRDRKWLIPIEHFRLGWCSEQSQMVQWVLQTL